MKRLFITTLLLITFIGGLTACVNDEKQSAINTQIEKVKELTVKLEGLGSKLKDAEQKYQDGKLTAQEFKDLTADVKTVILETKDGILETKDEIIKIQESGVGWLEMVGAVLIGVASRGSPSKGPLALIQNLFSARRKES